MKVKQDGDERPGHKNDSAERDGHRAREEQVGVSQVSCLHVSLMQCGLLGWCESVTLLQGHNGEPQHLLLKLVGPP